MNAQQEVFDTLKEFKQVLLAEREALIKNDSTKVVELVEKKQLFLEKLPELNPAGLKKEDLTGLAEEIKQLQQTNLLLTQQALQYQETVMEAITKGVKNSSTTYSKKGNYTAADQASLIDQSL
ncbi:flagellar motor switch protein [Carnobacterium mobile]|uniref:flagellar motor switch protein n=1 Tax=Carnobacterium mobile TaxID=2750 RepID=UPI00054D2033|nr:flagellar motor switch protein [Carnobacterium mobile]